MLVNRTLVLSTCFALLGSAGMAGAAERINPVQLTPGQMDKVRAGASSHASDPNLHKPPHNPDDPGGKNMLSANASAPPTTF
jgi:hypothetical protein